MIKMGNMMNPEFYSIDRLVEFGLSMAVSQQMITSMNQAIQQMHIPGSIQLMPVSTVFYVVLEGKSVGPLGEFEFTKLLESGKVNKDTLAWVPGMASWKPIAEIPAILKLVALAPPPIPEI